MRKKIISCILILTLLMISGCSRDPAPAKPEYTFAYSLLNQAQEYTVESTGYYLLEVWGAQGGGCEQSTDTGYQVFTGGLGGYARGYVKLEKGDILYVCIGGKGGDYDYESKTGTGGFNGGGYATKTSNVNHIFGGGGGATHIARQSGTLASLISDKDSVLLVAGGGGGARSQSNVNHPQARFGNGGDGGGESGGLGQFRGQAITPDIEDYFLYRDLASTQESGAAFGQGQISTENNAGGGGGWYGGYNGNTITYTGTGHGGSGHLGDVEQGSMESGMREGNGLARITWVGYSLPKE